MVCISPLSIANKNGRYIVPCGRCNFCLQTRRNEWVFRLEVELKHSLNAKFVTLTYSDDNLPPGASLVKRDVQLFFKRLRKEQARYTNTKIRYYIAGEYGEQFGRPHYHLILFNFVLPFDFVQKAWNLGFAHTGESVGIDTIRYATKYIINYYDEMTDGRAPPFSLMSRKPGLGYQYVGTHSRYHKSAGLRPFANVNGIKRRLPRYLRNKIFDPYELQRVSLRLQSYGEKVFRETIQHLSDVHPDPLAYYDEIQRNQHDRIKRVNKSKLLKT